MITSKTSKVTVQIKLSSSYDRLQAMLAKVVRRYMASEAGMCMRLSANCCQLLESAERRMGKCTLS